MSIRLMIAKCIVSNLVQRLACVIGKHEKLPMVIFNRESYTMHMGSWCPTCGKVHN
jgi:hypothetical protein